MKILFLAKFSEVEQHLLHFTNKIHQKSAVEVDVLSVIPAYPQVPLMDDGRIIEACVDYDLSTLYNDQVDELAIAERLKEEHDFIQNVNVHIGQLERIVKHELKNKKYDFVFMGAHKTTLFEDLTHETTVSRIIEIADIPVFSMKCDQSHQPTIDNIGVFDDFSVITEHPSLGRLANELDATVHLYHITDNELTAFKKEEVEARMLRFASKNKLRKVQLHIVSIKKTNEENIITKSIAEQNLHIVAITHLHRHKMSWIPNKSLKSSIADHIFSPLIIY